MAPYICNVLYSSAGEKKVFKNKQIILSSEFLPFPYIKTIYSLFLVNKNEFIYFLFQTFQEWPFILYPTELFSLLQVEEKFLWHH